MSANLLQNLAPVSPHLLRMQPQHRIAVARILTTERHHRLARLQVDAWHTYRLYPSLTGPGNDIGEVVLELLAVQMAVGIDHDCLFIMAAA